MSLDAGGNNSMKECIAKGCSNKVQQGLCQGCSDSDDIPELERLPELDYSDRSKFPGEVQELTEEAS